MIRFCCILVFLPVLLSAQFTDDFSDGDFTVSPAWSGDTADFTIENIFGNNRLRSNSTTASSNFYLSTTSALVNDAQWEFWINLAFNTSSANYADIYLTSDSANLKAPNNNGYFVKIGNTQDEISLYRKVAGVSTKIIDGADGVTNLTNIIIKIRVIRDSLNVWTLERDMSGSGNSFVSEGSVTDASVLTSSFFGIHIFQSTASFFQRHYFDDFYAGDIIGDTVPPAISAVNVISNNTLDLRFTEPVEKISAETISNYSVNNGIGNPSSAARDVSDSSIVRLIFSGTFQNGITNTLTVSGIKDLSDNTLTSATAGFVFFIPEIPVPGDVVINEIFPDPDPPVGLPNGEFVELYNRSNKVFDLAGWKFSDAASTVTLNSFILTPGSYLILCSNSLTSQFAPFGNTLGVGTLPSLNNTSDDLYLRDNNNLLIDRLSYSDTWYRDAVKRNGGWTLERVDANFICHADSNWTASSDVSGGTPGSMNSVAGIFTDNTPPRVVSVQMIAADTLKVIFSKPLDSAAAVNVSNYSVNNAIGNPQSVLINALFTETTLTFSQTFDSSTVYALTVTGVKDCPGNTAVGDAVLFSLPEPASKFEVLMTELFPDPDPQVTLPAKEFVELFNNSMKAFSLKNWIFSDASSTVTLPDYLLLPGEFLILCASANVPDFLPYGKTLGLSSLPSLNNDSDELTLRNPAGIVIHYVSYSSAWYRDGLKKDGGWTLEMMDTDNPCSGAGNWRASVDPRGGTPGTVNSVKAINPDEVSPALNFALVQDSLTLLVRFDEPLDEATALNVLNYVIAPGTYAVTTATFTNASAVELLLTLNAPLQRNVIYTLTVSNVADCTGNPVGALNTAQFGVPENPDSADIVINEILSNPVTFGVDFIELYNRSQKVIDLKDLLIARKSVSQGDTTSALASVSGFQLLPGNYVALTSNPSNILATYHTPNPKAVISVSGMPGYDDNEDVVMLFNRLRNNSVIDAVHYSRNWHFALLDVLNGVSLERINYNGPSQDKNNWHSAASTVGYATPAYQNSHFGELAASASVFTLEPKTFSPNNDGYQDFLNIRYNLDQSGYIANIWIFDSDGRKVRNLVENWLLDLEGTILWDGVMDNGTKAPIGIYIVIAELFDLTGKTKKFKEVCVVAGRL